MAPRRREPVDDGALRDPGALNPERRVAQDEERADPLALDRREGTIQVGASRSLDPDRDDGQPQG